MSKQIELTQGKSAIIDDADFEWLNRWKWHYCADKNSNGYAARTQKVDGKQIKISMHRLILDAPTNSQVDHINGDGLDNRQSNLRLATHTQNTRNGRAREGTSVYKGVSFYHGGRWQAQINTGHHVLCLGYYATQWDAAKAYNEAALKHHGEFARINVLPDKPTGDDLPLFDPDAKSSKFKGVSYMGDRRRWRAYITIDHKRYWLGQYDTENEAALAYDTCIKKYGLNRRLNFPD